MELVNISQLRSGQTIARAVTNKGGAVLCPPGFRLTDVAIERLKNAGVESVIVESYEDRERALQERVDALQERFRGIEDPLMLQLKAAIENRLRFMRFEQA